MILYILDKKYSIMKNIFKVVFVIPFIVFTLNSCAQKKETPKITFIELGSVRCIPCQKMQKVIKKVEEKYPTQVKTIFYDVWTDDGKKYADIYKINLIPTQVFLDKNGKEFSRHQGYFEFEELEKVLQQKLK